VIEQGETSVLGYFPASNWYSYYDAELVQQEQSGGKWLNLTAPIDFIPLHIRGGYILPTQEPANNTFYSRQNPFGLIVALDSRGEAKGDLFYDDGEAHIAQNLFYYSTLSVSGGILQMTIQQNDYTDMSSKVLNKIRILVSSKPSMSLKFTVNGTQQVASKNVQFKDNEIVLTNLNLTLTTPFQIGWS
jgi:maltase-glucoamylase